ncbi:NTP pyrophosphohydrolase [Marmoricola endophyticus]|uniref:NAD(+) diphosphatase n=1 Tax=Marmoricola endophyticus TaxID=2040280 RepID=A0A917F3J1_9ACTN|nr:NAD(+) diphosphatase [Marmoricola endophyticus]GGF41604.1 NTP pyrophosphohydrolase [Marmoricola endophyticus]
MATSPADQHPPLALTRAPHDREAERRTDEEWLVRAWSDPATRVLVLAGARFRVVDGDVPWVAPSQAPDGVKVLLGEKDGVTHVAVVADEDLADDGEGVWASLRDALSLVDRIEAELVAHAVGIAEWLRVTRWCPRCAGRLEPTHAGHQLQCTGTCGRAQFPRTDPAVIMVVVDGEAPDDRVLLGRSPLWPTGRYSTLAGFVEPGESAEDAVRREVQEETGVRVDRVEYFGSQPWPLPASLMIGFVAHAATTDVAVDGVEIEDARWFTREELGASAEDGSLVLPGGISISHYLIEWWYGAHLSGSWR